jgi:hypothetical protein
MADTTARLQLPYLIASQAQKEVTHNEALDIVDTILYGSVISLTATPPGAPAENDTYIVGASATGAWAGKDDYVTRWSGLVWLFVAPFEGLEIWNVSAAKKWRYSTSLWAEVVEGSGAGGTNYYGSGADGSKTFATNTYLGHAAIDKYSVSSNVVTITTKENHGFTSSNLVSIQHSTLSAINNTAPPTTGAFSAGTHYYSITVTGLKTFTFAKTTGDVLETSEVNADATCCKWDGPVIVRNYTDLIINSGVTVTPAARCKGVLIYATGNVTINGTLTMTARGASAAGVDSGLYLYASYVHDSGNEQLTAYLLPAVGASGGAALIGAGSNGNAGTAGTDGKCGGGGGGGRSGYTSGRGGVATSFSGGTGGGGADDTSSTDGSDTGGPGGAASENGSGGGAGNPGGAKSTYGAVGENGTGGLLILICAGDLSIGATGIVAADGSAGGNGNPVYGGASGGGSGGGSVNLFYSGTLANSGTVRANGGAKGTSSSGNGGDGGAGSTRIVKIAA